jgi:hypothetical protein
MGLTIVDLQIANESAGMFWFSPGAMEFFNSRVHEPFYETDDGVLFISSETQDSEKQRRYTVRRIVLDELSDEYGRVLVFPSSGSTPACTTHRSLLHSRSGSSAS